MQFIEFIKAAVIGIIQGITEWLPISSTGHMILAEEFIKLNVSPDFWNLFLVIIQLGSILAVLFLFFHKLNPFSKRKSPSQRHDTLTLWLKVIVGAIPAAIMGFLLDDLISSVLSGAFVIAGALIIYGILFIVLENRKREPTITTLDGLTYGTALKIGAFQVLSLIPGTSRSGSTILGGIIVGTSRAVAAEFSFFLAIPIMLGASLLRTVKFIIGGFSITGTEVGVLIVGVVVAFVVSLFAIKFLMSYIRKHDFKAFGWYRIILGIVVILYFGAKLFLFK
ncbi:MAG: undecaprenyl-diphosphate phosphatase [Clostridia bacterium]